MTQKPSSNVWEARIQEYLCATLSIVYRRNKVRVATYILYINITFININKAVLHVQVSSFLTAERSTAMHD